MAQPVCKGKYMSIYDSGVRPIIDSYLEKRSKELRDYGEYWSASSAGYCMRLVIMRRLKVPKSPEMQEDQARTTRVFEAGHIFHKFIQDLTVDAGVSIAQEVELQDEDLKIRGHFDDLVLLEGKLILYDVKTAHSKWFEYAKGRPMSHYNRMQLGTYMYMLRKGLGIFNEFDVKQANHGELPQKAGTITEYMGVRINDLTEARILKISKDDLRLHEMQLLWSEELKSEVFNYWNELNAYWKNKKLPKCTCLDQEGGFMGKRSKAGNCYNDYFYNEEPCSLEWAKQHKDLLKGWTYAKEAYV